jgi:hypothetical protein
MGERISRRADTGQWRPGTFSTVRPRAADFQQFSAPYGQSHTVAQEYQWLHDQGPLAPDLLGYIATQRSYYDAFVFSRTSIIRPRWECAL